MRSDESRVRAATIAGGVSAAACGGLAVVSQLDAGTLQSWADLLAIDGEPAGLERVLGRTLAGAAIEMAAGFGALAAMLLLARRRAGSLAAGSASAPAPPESGRGRTRPALAVAGAGAGVRPAGAERVVAVVVVAAGVLLAARGLAGPMRVDETVTALHYATGPLWHAWSAYDAPNNHVLHTLLVWIAHRLGGWHPVALRMPAFLAACAALPAAWWLVRREHGWTAAAFATALLATSPLFTEFASSARGYSLMLLCFVAALWFGGELVLRPGSPRLWAGYSAATGLGFFTIPLMAFPAAVTGCWMLLLCWRERGPAALGPFALRLAAWTGVALALASLLYAPVLWESGSGALLANKHVEGWAEGAWRWRLWAMNTVGAWMRINLAVPLWAQPTLFAAVVAGAFARRRDAGPRGLFAAAVVGGTASVLAIRPVSLQPRMTLWLVFALTMLAGAGLARALQTLGRGDVAKRNWIAGRVLAVLLVLGAGAWWTRSTAAEWLTGRSGWSPAAASLVAAVEPGLRPGDAVAADWALGQIVFFHLRAAGRPLSPAADAILPGGRKVTARRVEGPAEEDGERVFVFWDDDAPWPASALDDRFKFQLDDVGSAWCLAAQARAGQVLRLPGWPDVGSAGEAGGFQRGGGAGDRRCGNGESAPVPLGAP